MKQLAPGVGWVLQQTHLYWTENNGQDWADITPGDTQQQVSNVFFLNEQEGWAFLYERNLSGELTSISLASTRNAGNTWKISVIGEDEFKIPPGFAGPTSMFFVDSQHGWIVLRLTSSSAFSIGLMLKTEDGGITWSELQPPPSAGAILFTTAQDGWMVGGPAGDVIWATRDGGKTWKEKTAPVSEIKDACHTSYRLQDSSITQEVRLTATMACSDHSYLLDYTLRTEDGSWQLRGRNGQEVSSRTTAISSFSGADAIHVSTSPNGVATIQAPEGTTSLVLPVGAWPEGSITQATFSDNNNGWMLYSAGKCEEPRNLLKFA